MPDLPERKPPPYFYRGVAADVATVHEEQDEPALLPLAVVATTVDLALSLVVDTILLPIDLAVWLNAPETGDEQSKPSATSGSPCSSVSTTARTKRLQAPATMEGFDERAALQLGGRA
jgi:uncharacterized protein YceK